MRVLLNAEENINEPEIHEITEAAYTPDTRELVLTPTDSDLNSIGVHNVLPHDANSIVTELLEKGYTNLSSYLDWDWLEDRM